MTASRLGLAHISALIALTLSGCLVHERDPGDAGGDASCSSMACGAESACYCARCVSRTPALPACDPPCDTAQAGDFCTTEGRTCPTGICGSLVCTAGTFVAGPPTPCIEILDAGPPDGATCPSCPATPPGCTYDGVPCACSHVTCAPVHCGRVVCPSDTTCCNASCGICVGPGGGCVALECAPDCSPQDAHSGGRCADDAGWAWDGAACRALACRCVGTQCDQAFATQADCEAYFGACPAPSCGADDAIGEGGCAVVIGYAFSTRGCLPISGCSCTGADCDVVSGRTEAACNEAHTSCPILD